MDSRVPSMAACADLDQPSDTLHRELEQENPTITSLPVDVLFQIATHLDCSSLLVVRVVSLVFSFFLPLPLFRKRTLTFRKTCKIFDSVIQMRQIWQRLIRDFEGYAFKPLGGALVDYTVAELARWILRRARARDIYGGMASPRLRTRVLPNLLQTGQGITYYKLLPGGRWLILAARTDMAMYLLDLDSADPEPKLLGDPCKFDPEIVTNGLDFDYNSWTDPSKPCLSFRIGGFIPDSSRSPRYMHYVASNLTMSAFKRDHELLFIRLNWSIAVQAPLRL